MELFSDEYWMNEALKQARIAADEGEIPVGAVIVVKNRVIAKAYNQTEKLTDVTAHAEILAITAASNALGAKYLPECKLYVTLEPCIMCAGACFWAQLGELHFAASDPKRGFSKTDISIIHPKTKLHSGILQEESKDLLQTFFKNLRN
ncbi:nucleoside deaminase [Cyclobacterium qasimii]|uniref:tRNA-specific adenosine deaminase n=2 Tax=Cyclobacterium qasimii TaxID=1350429 RepID=S7WPL9_9BACT|nr:nucleoside deaminase [Cyclobacterium qasimii]EPR66083.1 tRNA-specific adenosine-34 deaminase [Cyclobacterium qasimii M12-11B]GEO21203.1 tRNA-specific adenosine deaminase [Cyclobacterium qasimii]